MAKKDMSRTTLQRWLPLLIMVLAAAGIFLSGAHRYISLESIANHKAELIAFVSSNRVAAVTVYMLVYIAVTALSIPGALLMTLLGGILFPFWLGSVAVVVSATVGAILLFLVARSSLGEALRQRGGETVTRMADGFREDSTSYMLFLRLVPVFPFALVNLGAAIMGVPLRTYVWTTFVGIMPGSLAFVFAATSLGGILDERKAAFDSCKASGKPDCVFTLDYSTLVSPNLLYAFAALGCIAMIPVVARRFFGKSAA
ncbi:MAG: TVP38/TMEM64 family protein [Beijerinckiaceae bacterium]